MPDCVSSNINLFADDCVIFCEITDPNDTNMLQKDIDAVSAWCRKWHMELNTTKCKAMRVSRVSSSPAIYHLNNVPLQTVTSYRYLDVHITSSLSWSLHIEQVINNANRMLGYLRRNFSSAPISLKTLLYTTLVRSKLEYAASIWDPGTEILIKSLELVQNNAARFITGNYSRASSVTSMKNTLNLPQLAHRRQYFHLCLFHRMYYHNHYLRSILISEPSYVSARTDHRHKVNIISCRTKSCFQSFIPRTANDWNHLPGPIAAIEDHCLFRTTLANTVTSRTT